LASKLGFQSAELIAPNYILNLNGIIADNDTMDAQTLGKVKMPNRNGFVTFSRGK
jgi:S-disulfanyl-L-cysteine oxidoreductase SoxD